MVSASVAAQNFATKMQESGLSVNDFIKAQKYSAVSFAAQDKSLTNVRSLLDEYNSGLATTGNICKNTGLAQQDFAKAVGESNRVAGNYLGNLNGGKATMSGYVGSLISAKIATIGLQVATTALNMAITMGISLLFQLVASGIDYLIHAEERAAEAAEKAIDQYKNAQEELKSNKETIKEISSEYEKLSKGVDKYGNNISLSTDEFQKYHEITNKIANMFPNMIAGFDSEGNVILKVTGRVEELTKAYKEQSKVAKEEYLRGAADIYKDAVNKSGDSIDNAKLADNLMTYLYSDKNSEEWKKAANHFVAHSDDYKSIMKDAGYDIDWDFWIFDSALSRENKIREAVEKNPEKIASYYKTASLKASSIFNDSKQAILANLELNDQDYNNLSDQNKAFVQRLIYSLDADYLQNKDWTIDDLFVDFKQKYKSIFLDDKIANAFEYMSDAQDKLAQGKITIGKYQEEINDFINSISGLDAETQKYAKISFGLDLDEDGISKDFKNVVSQLMDADTSDQFSKEFYESFVGKLSLPEFNAILNNGDQFKDSITAWLQEHSGATAEEFSSWLNGILTDSANSISDSSSTILTAFDKAATGITEFKNAMDSSKGSIKSGTEAFEGYADAYTNAMKLINEGYDLDNGKLYAYMELLLGKDTLEKYGYNVDKLKGKLSELKGVYGDKNSLGDGFIPKLEKATEKTNGKLIRNGEVIASYNKKTKELNIDNNHFADVAKALGMTEDGLVACIQAMSTWSDVALESLDEIKARAESAGAVYREQFDKELKGKDIVNLNTLRDNMKSNGYTDKQTYDAIEQLKSDKNVITIDVKADSSAKDIIEQLSKVNLIGKDSEGKSVLDLSGTVEMLKSTGSSITDITDIITTLNDSDSIQVKVDGKSIEDLGVLRTKIEELYNTTSTQVQRANEVLKELGLTDFNFVFDSNSKKEVEDGLINIRTILESLKKDGKIDLSVDGASEAQLIFTQLMHEQQELNAPTVMKVDTSQLGESQESVKTAIQKIQEFKRICNGIEINQELGIDTTEAEKKASSLANQIKGIDSNILTTLSLDASSVDSLKASINNVTGEQLVKVGIDQKAIIGWKPDDKNAKVKFTVDSTDVDKYKKQSDDKTAIVHFSKDSAEVDRYDPKDLKRTVTYRVKTEGSVEANGTAHVSGTAKAGGDWGAATGGTALVGELGRKNFATLYSDI